MTDFQQQIKDADKAYRAASSDRDKARRRLRRVLLRAKNKHTGDEVAAMWGKSRQALYKIIGPGDGAA